MPLTYAEVLAQDVPRLTVPFRMEGGHEMFSWDVRGAIPGLKLVGAITRAQGDVFFRALEPCGDSALVITYDPATRAFAYYIHPDIPLESLVGMLEAIKQTVLSAHMAGNARTNPGPQRRPPLLGPDGQPMRG